MDLGLAGRTAIVTGGGSNIGRAISLTLVGEGANVVIAELDEAQGSKVAAQANTLRAGGRCLCVKTDVTSLPSVEDMVSQTLREFGKIDVLVNNVGWNTIKPFVRYSPEEVERVIRLSFLGAVYCCRAVLPHMVQRKYGRVVNISSDAGRVGEPSAAIYSSMKAGVIGLAKSLAREMGRFAICVNVVCHGLTIPRTPEELGEMSMWSERERQSVFSPETVDAAIRRYAVRRVGTPPRTQPTW